MRSTRISLSEKMCTAADDRSFLFPSEMRCFRLHLLELPLDAEPNKIDGCVHIYIPIRKHMICSSHNISLRTHFTPKHRDQTIRKKAQKTVKQGELEKRKLHRKLGASVRKSMPLCWISSWQNCAALRELYLKDKLSVDVKEPSFAF